jgi:hypothetical protein
MCTLDETSSRRVKLRDWNGGAKRAGLDDSERIDINGSGTSMSCDGCSGDHARARHRVKHQIPWFGQGLDGCRGDLNGHTRGERMWKGPLASAVVPLYGDDIGDPEDLIDASPFQVGRDLAEIGKRARTDRIIGVVDYRFPFEFHASLQNRFYAMVEGYLGERDRKHVCTERFPDR